MVHHLIAAGSTTDRSTIAACEVRAMRIVCIYRDRGQQKYKLTDGVRVIIKICHTTMMRFSRTPSVVPGHAKMVLRLVLSGKITVEESFKDMAKDMMDWVTGKSQTVSQS